jgi:hypothetical protein
MLKQFNPHRRRGEILRQGCPCGMGDTAAYKVASVSLVMQLATIGLPKRLRAKGVTLHLCENCIRKIHTKEGRNVRFAMAAAVQAQLVDIRRQEKGPRATRA